ncbi:hypothetical protein K0C01_00635 [Salinarchaeum sp. IM2453]|uniref:DUF5798 family protein n=1 Tax=Salinarchaeum sp. IM2453 TaxID=2862870 RepID=UPI001C8327C1|nr:DUF5798 family protein [Salinarchaeum sp. IM2453]QZA88712.1 hypothetical protein K0C01_00635 [Salinarchaeum sp. IM2453]
MGLGSTAKKIQVLTETAETLLEQFKAVKERITGLEETADETNRRIKELEQKVEYQQEILTALAEKEDIELPEPPETQSEQE